MSGMELDDLTADALREFGNIGAGHAATALSVLLQGRVMMSVTDARLCPFRDIVDVVGGLSGWWRRCSSASVERSLGICSFYFPSRVSTVC
ncbi:chemotaxis protein CheC [Alicyclobacillus fastidiosus]|uniref:chemotaxis protein CheC n=1 Tax=Alicyclobacillus fastidiosus TaxID=392011 RepID=UPI0023E97778|nr:chemotaxis protein CheC [Alicyclobacillus fastidiosus]GMA61544.1 hypothetical protein GCM10025859_19840 [Alicyclobacillus fastidiosus]